MSETTTGGIRLTMGPVEWLLVVILSLLWGGSFFFVEIALEALPPLTIVALRVSIAAGALHLVLLASGRSMPGGFGLWAAFFGMGLINNAVPFTLIAWGQVHIGSGLAAILNATMPIFVVLVAQVATDDEKVNRARFAGIALGFAGVAVMIGPAALANIGSNVVAQLAVLGAALSYSCGVVFGRRFARLGINPMATATGQVTAAAIILAPLALAVDQPWHLAVPELEVWGAIGGLGVLSTGLAYIIYFRILAVAGATNLSLVTFIVPASAILLGTIVLGEHLHITHIAGIVLIAAGLIAIDGRLLKRRSARSGSAA